MTGPRWNLRPALRACLIWSTAPGSGLWVVFLSWMRTIAISGIHSASMIRKKHGGKHMGVVLLHRGTCFVYCPSSSPRTLDVYPLPPV